MECRPLGFLIGLPFALLSLALSAIGAVIWLLGTLVSLVCPCFGCFAVIANWAVCVISLPINIIGWFTSLIPC